VLGRVIGEVVMARTVEARTRDPSLARHRPALHRPAWRWLLTSYEPGTDSLPVGSRGRRPRPNPERRNGDAVFTSPDTGRVATLLTAEPRTLAVATGPVRAGGMPGALRCLAGGRHRRRLLTFPARRTHRLLAWSCCASGSPQTTPPLPAPRAPHCCATTRAVVARRRCAAVWGRFPGSTTAGRARSARAGSPPPTIPPLEDSTWGRTGVSLARAYGPLVGRPDRAATVR
jgi:hypothetical protein